MLAPSPTELFPEHECPHRFLRTLHEGLRLLWSVDIASPDFVLLVLSIEHRDRVPIGHTNHGASQRFSVSGDVHQEHRDQECVSARHSFAHPIHVAR